MRDAADKVSVRLEGSLMRRLKGAYRDQQLQTQDVEFCKPGMQRLQLRLAGFPVLFRQLCNCTDAGLFACNLSLIALNSGGREAVDGVRS